MMKLRDDIEDCRNRININFSFFKINLDKDQDEIDQYVPPTLCSTLRIWCASTWKSRATKM